jgi:hypothetical protein
MDDSILTGLFVPGLDYIHELSCEDCKMIVSNDYNRHNRNKLLGTHLKKTRSQVQSLLLCGWKYYNRSSLYGIPQSIIQELIQTLPKNTCYNVIIPHTNTHRCIIL